MRVVTTQKTAAALEREERMKELADAPDLAEAFRQTTHISTQYEYSKTPQGLEIPFVDLENVEHVTIVRLKDGLGDNVSLAGAIQKLKEKWPHIKIDFMGIKPIDSILENHSAIDRILEDGSQAYPSTQIFNLGIVEPAMWMERFFKFPEPGNRSILYAHSMGLGETSTPRLHISDQERLEAKEWLNARNLTKPVGIVYKSAGKKKNFLNTPELFTRIQWEHDAYLVDHEGGFFGANPTTKGLTIRQQAAIISESSCVISPDTGWLHVAGALGIPLVGLFGSFPAHQTMGIYNVPFLALTGPCPHGAQPCRTKLPCRQDEGYIHPPCLSQKWQDIYPSINSFLIDHGR